MKKCQLPIRWIQWRKRRYQSLAVQGLASHLAWDVANGEAKGRHRISRVVGYKAATEAELQCIGEGDDLRFVFVGKRDGLSDEQLAAIK